MTKTSPLISTRWIWDELDISDQKNEKGNEPDIRHHNFILRLSDLALTVLLAFTVGGEAKAKKRQRSDITIEILIIDWLKVS